MIKLDGLTAFVAIVEAGSISEAARRLRLSKSVMSERLADLEREVTASLVQRTTRKLTLTEDGEAFYRRAKAITLDIEQATAEIAERRGEFVGPLRVAAPVSFGTMHLGPALYAFLAAHPGVELMLDLDDRHIDLSSEGFDLAVRVGRPSDSRLIARPLAPSRRVLVASPNYLKQNGAPETLAALETHAAILYTNRGTGDWRFQRGDSKVTARTSRTALRVNNGDIMCAAAEAGLGIALLPSFIVHNALAARRLVELRIDAEVASDLVYAAFPAGRHRSEKVRALVAHLQRAFGDPPYWDAPVRAHID